MAVKVKSSTLLGIDAVPVDVETQIIGGLKRFSIVGLPDGVVREAKDRVRCAIENCGYSFPSREVIVSLAPAALPKAGPGFDLAIALSILAADAQLDRKLLFKKIFVGELTLDAKIKIVGSELATAAYLFERKQSYQLITSEEGAVRARIVPEVSIQPVATLQELVALLNGRAEPRQMLVPKIRARKANAAPGFGDVIGQYAAKRALEVAAAGGHNVLMIGPPGSGKSMLAQRVNGILPPLGAEERLEVTKIYSSLSVHGGQPALQGLASEIQVERPFRAPHHTTSVAGLIGGGSIPQPGEISLAHKGVLFLDEFTELRRDVMEALREPLETRHVTISRAKYRIAFPSDFILLAAMNPCPCGRRGVVKDHASEAHAVCECLPQSVKRYVQKVSGPIADRMDLQIWVGQIPLRELSAELGKDPTGDMRERVKRARRKQIARFGSSGRLNAAMSSRELKEHCVLDHQSLALIERASDKFNFSARAFSRILKVATTISDLEDGEGVQANHIAEALSYRLNLSS